MGNSIGIWFKQNWRSLKILIFTAIGSLLLSACDEYVEPIFPDPPPGLTEEGSNGLESQAYLASLGAFIEKDPQDLSGDASKGLDTILDSDIMTCGVPYSLWAEGGIEQAVLRFFMGGTYLDDPLPNRTGLNEDLPFWLSAFDVGWGTPVAMANCLTCHASKFDDEIIVGMPNNLADFTAGGILSVPDWLIELLGSAFEMDAGQIAFIQMMFERFNDTKHYTQTRTVGANPAFMLAAAMATQHDVDDLSWISDPDEDVFEPDENGFEVIVGRDSLTADPPPWWRVKKKNALFSNGMGRGDHRGAMQFGTSVCVDNEYRAAQIDEAFKDIQAFIVSLESPTYQREIDMEMAARGKAIFNVDCAGCHGTYGESDEEDTYPNLLIPLEVIGTDPALALAGPVYAPALIDWLNESFYGNITQLVVDDPFIGYIAPPLDGVWATAPYFHNGSVPNVEMVLKSWVRPKYWSRVNRDNNDFDEEKMGWPWKGTHSQEETATLKGKKFVYDTTYWSQSNEGHTFGDHLTDAERRDVIEYLKTI